MRTFVELLGVLYIGFLLLLMADMSDKYSTQISTLKEACGITDLNEDVIPKGKCIPTLR